MSNEAGKQEAVCESCRANRPEDKVTFGPDPYGSEINDDDTPVWLCEKCRQESSDAI